VTQDSLVARPATGVAGFQTVTSGLRRVIWRHVATIGFRGDLRSLSGLLVILICSKAHPKIRSRDLPKQMSASRRERRS
jgi:hypothetical protein